MIQLLLALHSALDLLIYLYMIVVMVSVLMTWFPGASTSRFGLLLGRLVDPFLRIFQRFIPPLAGIDFSPVIAFLALSGLRWLLNYLFAFLLNLVIR
ncbi:YggT family protein [Lacticaseibacillus saniviri]|uniref:YggT family protein n=1 Tax=Lacticaseibacillus saniviri JCM 17471 = DSM 24301 TaxID=1293598 RepID=A0A0R2MXT7_9LACO|nr:YggT family protein [Lacticaseibacillus saniviri]KRO18373.1 hypothetical protein IV56_GL001505 [Lacticaseibacillus saniviri JCM 17471 = DSM 24301]MCG4282175.1 YggT family protein [Lacticaseibacillus saniviri]